jgi:ribonuclease D
LNGREKELLKRLFELRDRHARRLDLPPHNVIGNPELLDLSRRKLRPEGVRFARRMSQEDRRAILEELEKELKRENR